MSYRFDPFLLTDLLVLKKNLNWNIFVETGTELGMTTDTVSPWFAEYYTCEVLDELVELLKKNRPHQFIENEYYVMANRGFNGEFIMYPESSLTFLPKILKKINHSEFFIFLDSHIDNTHNPSAPPILEELDIIYKSGLTPMIIIHDFDTKRDSFGFYKFDITFNDKGDELNYGSIDIDYLTPMMDKIFGKDGWDYKFNTNSFSYITDYKGELGSSQGCAYFWKKTLTNSIEEFIKL